MAKKIARVFMRKNQYTPDDNLVFFGRPGLFLPEVDEVHISCTFSWDKQKAERLYRAWSKVLPTKLGGPAYPHKTKNIDFTPGLYLKKGYVFTSRGCPYKCEYCLVQEQEGGIKELSTIHSGHYLMDNNILACSKSHIQKVFEMLSGQKGVKLQGGIDVRLLKTWHAKLIAKLNLNNVAIAYDNPKNIKHVQRGLSLLLDMGIPHGKIHCFVLGGFYNWDTPKKAEIRCREIIRFGATPTAMFYRNLNDMDSKRPIEWNKWVQRWSCQRVIFGIAKTEGIVTYQQLKKEQNAKAKNNK